MSGFLDGGVAEAFAGIFGGFYLDASLYRPATFTDDGAGGGADPADPAPEAVKVQIDTATEAMRASDGFADGDVRILMLAHGVTAPNTDCEVEARGVRYSIQSVSNDPCISYYEMRGRKA